MRAWLQGVRLFAVVFGLAGLLSGAVRADALYSLTNLGPGNPIDSYLNALSPVDQAAFQAGSFDISAHPAPLALPQYTSYFGGGLIGGFMPVSDQYYEISSMTTGNNLGVLAGVAFDTISGGPGKAQVALYIPDPHSITITGTPYPWSEQTVQSPGYVTLVTTTASAIATSQFYGTVAGINDHNNLALNEYDVQHYPTSSLWTTPTVPYLYSTTHGDVSLGSLGGSSGAASALNNSNQVVGWSQTVSGAQHAFLFSNGTMQDLNLLIPSSANINLIDAVGIDASGRIVAYGTDSSGQTDEFLLTPQGGSVPEPSTLAVFAVMIAAVAARQIRSQPASKR